MTQPKQHACVLNSANCTVFKQKNKTHLNYFLVQTNLIWSE